jgi:NAD(P)-dependent dehydrogenase (short-subunit alcohol dehydrogenase family)
VDAQINRIEERLKMKTTALITGGADRIGKAIALCCAELGYDIALHYSQSAEKAEATRMEILAKQVECHLYRADFNNLSETTALIGKISQTAEMSVLINNASLFFESSLLDSSDGEFERLFNINFKAPYVLIKEFAKRVKKGVVINILDTEVVRNQTKYFDYLITKKSLSELTRMAAFSLAPGIRVNAIAPGLILPPAGKDMDFLWKRAEDIPLKKVGSPQSITHAVKFLIENDFVTGQTIFVDGGEAL